MIPELITVVTTLLVGPLAFYLLSRHAKGPRFPVSILDKYGDIILLPIFNALAVHYGLLSVAFADMQLSLIAFVAAYIPTRVFIIWRKNFAKHDDWSRPKRGKFNVGGWYHVVFMICQLYVIVITMLNFYEKIVLWIPVIGFVILVVWRRKELSGR